MPTFSAREDAATDLLLRPEAFPSLPQRHAMERKLLLWRLPSFEPHSSWALYHLQREKRHLVRRLEHDPSRGIPLNADDPHIFGTESPFPSAEAQELLEKLEAINAPMFRMPKVIGMDGTMFGLHVGNIFQGTRVNWWSAGTDEWSPLVQFFEATVKTFEAILPRSTLREA